VKVRFRSDGSHADTGFLVTWAQEAGCGGLVTSPRGQLTSPLHPERYDHNLLCEWIIRLPPEDRVSISFDQFELERGGSGCAYDYLELREGGANSGPLVGRFCGTDIPPDYVSSSNQLHITFRSDYSVSHSGFRMAYEAACGGEFTAPSGLVSSPYHPGPYPR
jgi:cubilin